MKFFLFILLNAALFMRPSEVIPALSVVPVYNILISLTMLASITSLLKMVDGKWLGEQPTSFCVLALLPMTFFSTAFRLGVLPAYEIAVEFAKICIYYLLLLICVDTPARFLRFLGCLATFTLVLSSVAMLHFYGIITVESLVIITRGDEVGIDPFVQLSATGIYSDPNDLGSVLALSILIALSRLCDRSAGLLRLAWIVPIGLFFWALLLTQSRGGLLGFLTAISVLLVTRFGWKRAFALGVIGFPAIFMLVSGRQTRISVEEDTAMGRIEFWFEGFRMMARSPFFGVGVGQFQEEVRAVAHNSFVQAAAEMGLFAGMCFFGVYFVPFWSLYRLSPRKVSILDPELARLRPYLMGMIAGYVVSLMSISRNSVVPSYMITGIVVAYLGLIRGEAADAIPRSSFQTFRHLALVYALFMIALLVFVRSVVH